jgi:hypothetical protein
MAKTNAPKAHAGKAVVSIKVTLLNIKPPVWRRLLMPSAMTLADLHDAIQAAMGWDDSHLHVFQIDGRHYGDRSTVDDVADENRLTLAGIMKSGISRFAYTYDFGDSWKHGLVIETAQPMIPEQACPLCADGKRACPPEDSGGPQGYQKLLEVLTDPDNPKYAEQREWIGEDFNPEAFDIDVANNLLKAKFGQTRDPFPILLQ